MLDEHEKSEETGLFPNVSRLFSDHHHAKNYIGLCLTCYCTAWGNGNFDIFWRGWNHNVVNPRYHYPCCFVVVTCRDDFNDLVPRKRESWDIGRVECHEIAIQDSKYTFMRDNQEVILLSLEF